MKIDSKIQKTIDFYNNNSKKYSQYISSKVSIGEIEKFTSISKKGGKILDVGCAAGRDSRELVKRGFKVTGIDLSDGLLSIAKKEDKKTTYLKMDMRKLKFEKESFDGVYASATLLHLINNNDVLVALKEFYRVLNIGGSLFIRVKEQMGDKKSEVVKEKLSNHEPRYFLYFKEAELKKIVSDAGFTILESIVYRSTDQKFKRSLNWIVVYAQKL